MSSAAATHTRQLFGTDGIRGVAGEYPLDRRTVYAIGKALGQRLAERNADASVVIGQDTRESSAWISAVLAAGLSRSKVRVVSAGVITTPGIAYLARANGMSAGIVMSASHNPWRDNGIKVFGHDGYKLSDQLEHAIESDIFAHLEQLAVGAEHAGERFEMLPGDASLRQQYADGVISFWYRNKWLTPILTLERTYLTDEVNRNDGFRANLITLSVRKDF